MKNNFDMIICKNIKCNNTFTKTSPNRKYCDSCSGNKRPCKDCGKLCYSIRCKACYGKPVMNYVRPAFINKWKEKYDVKGDA